MAEHFFSGSEFHGGLLLGALLVEGALLVFVLVQFGSVTVHGGGWGGSRGLVENGGESLAGAVQLAADGIAGLAGERADFLVA